MTQEETNKRNEAIALLRGETKEGFKKEIDYYSYHKDYAILMYILKMISEMDYSWRIESVFSGFECTISELQEGYFKQLTYGYDGEIITAIWLTVSDFAMEFNKKKDEQ